MQRPVETSVRSASTDPTGSSRANSGVSCAQVVLSAIRHKRVLCVCVRARASSFYARACDLTVVCHVQVLTYKNKELHDILAQNGLSGGEEGAVLQGETSLESDA